MEPSKNSHAVMTAGVAARIDTSRRPFSSAFNRRVVDLAEPAPRRSLGPQLHFGKRAPNISRRHPLQRFPVPLRSHHIPNSSWRHQTHRPRFLSSHYLCRVSGRHRDIADLAHPSSHPARKTFQSPPSRISAERPANRPRNLFHLSSSFLRSRLHSRNSLRHPAFATPRNSQHSTASCILLWRRPRNPALRKTKHRIGFSSHVSAASLALLIAALNFASR